MLLIITSGKLRTAAATASKNECVEEQKQEDDENT